MCLLKVTLGHGISLAPRYHTVKVTFQIPVLKELHDGSTKLNLHLNLLVC